jgi:peptidoglycan/LPS O-acetylase OafA/YrhL
MSAAGTVAPSGRRFRQVDGLRGVAVMLVLAYHIGIASRVADRVGVGQLIWGLKAGVTVFFVISGYLLYLPYARATRDLEPTPGWRAFARRRAVRILPAYWLALTVAGLTSLSGHILSSDWWRYYGLVQIYDPRTLFGGLGVTWSLCVEATFYLILPVFGWAVGRIARRGQPGAQMRTQLWATAALAATALILRTALAGSATMPIAGHLVLATALPAQLDWFAIGIALAIVGAAWEASPAHLQPLRALAARPVACWLLAAGLFAAVTLGQRTDHFLTQYGLLTHVVLGAVAGFVVLPAMLAAAADPLALAPGAHPVARPTAWLARPLIVWLGTISYGIYLWQLPMRTALDPDATRILLGPGGSVRLLFLTAATTVAVAAGSWYLVEVRAQRLGRRRGSRAAGLTPGESPPLAPPVPPLQRLPGQTTFSPRAIDRPADLTLSGLHAQTDD